MCSKNKRKYFQTKLDKDEYGTPQDLFDSLNAEFHFTLDAAANAENHKCDRYFSKSQDGLSQSWDNEVVWCNPPYGRHELEWVKKGYESKHSTVVFLLPARTGTRWFQDYVLGKHEVRFIRGRLEFVGGGGRAPFDTIIIVMRNE